MRKQLLAYVEAHGVVHRRELLNRFPAHVVDDALGAGRIHAVFEAVYVMSGAEHGRHIRRRAALLCWPDAALSHADALDAERILPTEMEPDEPIHLMRSGDRPNIENRGIVTHRRRNFDASQTTFVGGDLRVVALEMAVIDSWPLLDSFHQRSPAILAVRDRRTTPERLLQALDDIDRVVDRRKLRQLFDLLAVGCHSELEIWGHQRVFSGRGLPRSRAQVPVALAGRTVYLDRYFEDSGTAVELDGAAYHGRPGQRERDLRRDALLAKLGIQTVRFSHRRLFHQPDEVVAELRAILSVRRDQLRGELPCLPTPGASIGVTSSRFGPN